MLERGQSYLPVVRGKREQLPAFQMETDEAAENVEMEPTADEESSVAEEPAQESSVPNDSTTGAEGEAAEGGEEEEGSIPLVPPPVSSK